MNQGAAKEALSEESFVEQARNTIFQTLHRCEALIPPSKRQKTASPPCGQFFGSWHAYFKHLLIKHTSKTSGYKCKGPRCTSNAYATSKDLKAHVEHAHMKNVPLTCPFRVCQPHNGFARERELIAHFHSTHVSLLGHIVGEDAFLPSYNPHRPSGALEQPPQWPHLKPKEIPWASFRLDSCPEIKHQSADWFHELHRAPKPSLRRTESPSPQAPSTPSKNRRLLTRNTTETSLESVDEPRRFSLDDLPTLGSDPKTHELRPAPVLFYKMVQSQGQMVEASWLQADPELENRVPPRSIFHDALELQMLARPSRGEG